MDNINPIYTEITNEAIEWGCGGIVVKDNMYMDVRASSNRRVNEKN